MDPVPDPLFLRKNLVAPGIEHILLSQIRNSPNLEGLLPVFISPRNRLVQLYPQAPGSLLRVTGLWRYSNAPPYWISLSNTNNIYNFISLLTAKKIAVYFHNDTKHRDTLCGQNEELYYVKTGGTYSNHWALKGYILVVE
jgi:hypothetical protein